MINGQKVLGIIPARGGSKTVPRKNIRLLAGKPLIAWTIEEAGKSKYIDRLIVSSEDAEIIKVAQEWGAEVPFVRPEELAEDETLGIEPVIHAINAIGEYYEYTILLQPTSPLRTARDIDECIHYCITEDAAFCVSVSIVDKNPYWMYTLEKNKIISPLMQAERSFDRRQDLPEVYALNGAIFLAQTNYLLQEKSFITEKTRAYIMPADRSLDIDREIDFLYAELIKSRS